MAAAGRAAVRLRLWGLAYLLLFSSSLSSSPALGDKRNGPFRMRENLWATGHFMGKKSMPGSSRLPSASLERSEPNNTPKAFHPVLTDVLENMKDLLTRELLKILLQERILEENRGKRDLKDQHS
ncbi:PREDICTED: neuromedin-B-like [Gekko japonicus]|uniref:Neuromedin-B-like n=1 Tax=Gekko japonicus TaxID=146911 RepID=A0ABM1JLN8_GEKJA|nr:PREDICTED: neuromedin-B-like [Gekko japonicus]